MAPGYPRPIPVRRDRLAVISAPKHRGPRMRSGTWIEECEDRRGSDGAGVVSSPSVGLSADWRTHRLPAGGASVSPDGGRPPLRHLGVEPGAGERPIPFCGSQGDPQDLGRLGHREAGEEAELHQFARAGSRAASRGTPRRGRSNHQRGAGRGHKLSRDRPASGRPHAAAAAVVLPARRGCGAWPRRRRRRSGHGCPNPRRPGRRPADIDLVHQGGRLEGLPGLLLGQPPGGQLAELLVDEREQRLGGPGVALLRPRGTASRRSSSRPAGERSGPRLDRAPSLGSPRAWPGGMAGLKINL